MQMSTRRYLGNRMDTTSDLMQINKGMKRRRVAAVGGRLKYSYFRENFEDTTGARKRKNKHAAAAAQQRPVITIRKEKCISCLILLHLRRTSDGTGINN